MHLESVAKTLTKKDIGMIWIDIHGIRTNEHEWTYKGDNYTVRYTTEAMLNIYRLH